MIPLRRLRSPFPVFIITFITLFYGRISVVVFMPQYCVDLGLPPDTISFYFTTLAAGTGVSNLASIYLYRRLTAKQVFYIIGLFSAGYIFLLLVCPTSEGIVIAGMIEGLAAGFFWTLLYIVLSGLIDEHGMTSSKVFASYFATSYILWAVTPLVAGVIIALMGYLAWLLSALALLVVGLFIVYGRTDASYHRTFNKYPLRQDLKKIVCDRRVLAAFVLFSLLAVFSLDGWYRVAGGAYRNVFLVHFGIRDYWIGMLTLIVGIVICLTYFLILRRIRNKSSRRLSRRFLAMIGLLIIAVAMVFLLFTSDPLVIFLVEGIIAALGMACYTFATQSLPRQTFKERIYLGTPLFHAVGSLLDAVWLAFLGWTVIAMGGYDSTFVFGGVTFQNAGLRILVVINIIALLIWVIAWWKLERHLAKDEELR